MSYKYKLSEEPDPIKKQKRREKNREKQKLWLSNPENKEKLYKRKREYNRRQYGHLQDYMNSQKKECSRCGYNKHPVCLDFHHINEKEKLFRLSQFQLFRTMDKIKAEIKKCIVLCSNCHRLEHYSHQENKRMVFH